jgi:hypothetical protein
MSRRNLEELVQRYAACSTQFIRATTADAALEPIYARIPARFPPLYERLVLSYRWDELDFETYRLLENPPRVGLEGLFGAMTRDRGLTEVTLPAGYIQFAKAAGGNYDPVCFDLSSRKKGRDFAVVRLDHEAILCDSKIKVVEKLAANFEQLMRDTIGRASGAS